MNNGTVTKRDSQSCSLAVEEQLWNEEQLANRN